MAILPPTASGTVGPFFPPHFFRPGDNDLTVIEPGAPTAAVCSVTTATAPRATASAANAAPSR